LSLVRSFPRTFSRNSTLNGDCSLAVVGSPDVIQKAGLAVKGSGGLCSSLLNSVLDYHLSDMNVEGVIEAEWEKHLNLMSRDFCTFDNDTSPDEMVKLDIKDLGGVFLTHAFLLVVALIVCQYEHRKRIRTAESKKKFIEGHVAKRFQDSPSLSGSDKTRTDLREEGLTGLEKIAPSQDAKNDTVITKGEMKEMLDQFKSEMSDEYARIKSSATSSGDWDPEAYPIY